MMKHKFPTMQKRVLLSALVMAMMIPAAAADESSHDRIIAVQQAQIQELTSRLARLEAMLSLANGSPIIADGKWKGDPTGLTGPRGPKGPKGAKGDTGATGPRGAKGVKGPKGNTGATGPRGPRGHTGSKGSDANFCDRSVGIQGRNGSGHYLGENNGRAYSKSSWGSWETFKIRCR